MIGDMLRRGVAALRDRASLRGGTDVEHTIERINSGSRLSAENFWLLACSAILASIGLDESSTAVIIGAMLISPLMGPILGVGLGLGTTDRALLQKSLRELGLTTVLTMAVSASYFLLSPLSAPTAELTSRTRPTLLDVGIAFFGGVAGIIAGSRKNPSLALPGVAIATALMPPLCTAGFGLATRDWTFLLGGFYLYALNAVFIAFATFLVVRLLRFPHQTYVTRLALRRERQLVAVVVIFALLPSVYFLRTTVTELRQNKRIAEFIHREVEGTSRAAPQWERRETSSGKVLEVFVVGQSVSHQGVDSLAARMSSYGLADMRLELVQSGMSSDDMKRFQGSLEREILKAATAAVGVRSASDTTHADSAAIGSLVRELATAFPEIDQAVFAAAGELLRNDSVPSAPAVLLTFRRGTRLSTRRQILDRAQEIARQHLRTPLVLVRER